MNLYLSRAARFHKGSPSLNGIASSVGNKKQLKKGRFNDCLIEKLDVAVFFGTSTRFPLEQGTPKQTKRRCRRRLCILRRMPFPISWQTGTRAPIKLPRRQAWSLLIGQAVRVSKTD